MSAQIKFEGSSFTIVDRDTFASVSNAIRPVSRPGGRLNFHLLIEPDSKQ
jgi:hypothetical protein